MSYKHKRELKGYINEEWIDDFLDEIEFVACNTIFKTKKNLKDHSRLMDRASKLSPRKIRVTISVKIDRS